MWFLVFALVSSSPDFNTRLIIKLSEILKTAPPTKIQVEILTQKEMQKEFQDYQMVSCMRSAKSFRYCADSTRNSNAFILGLWVGESDPKFLHIKVYEKAGVEATVHEYVHWWLYHATEPKGVINTEEMTRLFTDLVLSSQVFIDWLER